MNLREIKLGEALGRFTVYKVDRVEEEVIVKVKRFPGLLPSQPQFNSVHWLYLMVLQLTSQTHYLFFPSDCLPCLPAQPACFMQGTCESGSSQEPFPDHCYCFRYGHVNPLRLVTEMEFSECPGNEAPGFFEMYSESTPLPQ